MGWVIGPCPVLVEREPELRALSAAAGECSVGAGRLVLITGEAGAGKTRLWTEFLDTLPDGWTTEYVGGHQSDRSWSAPFEALVGTLDDRADPVRTLGDALAEACIARAAGSPLALVIEDLHFLDPAAVAALPYALARLRHASVLVVATYRIGSHPVGSDHSRAVAELLRQANAFEVRIGSLSESGVETMLEALGATADVATLFARTQGNPFFVEELARAGAGDDRSEDVPWTVSEAVLGRLSSLTDDAVHLAEVLAVAGGPLPGPVLDRMDDDWLRAHRVLADAALAVTAGDGAVLRHALVAEAVAGRLDGAARRRHHAAIAAAVEDVAPDRVELLAHHWAAAGETARAAPAASVAADRVAARGGHRTATELYRIALEHPPTDAIEASALLERAAAAAALATDEELARMWAGAARLAAAESGPRWKVMGSWGNPVFQRVVQRADADSDQAEALSARLVDAQTLVRQGDLAAATNAARRALSDATALGNPSVEADAALILWYAGDLDGARAELEHIAERARRADDPVVASNALGRLGRLLFARGDVSEAVETGAAAAAVARSSEDPMVWASTIMGVAWLYGVCGEVERAEALSDELLQADHPTVTIMGHSSAILPALERIDPTEARRHLDVVLPVVRTLEVDFFTMPILICDARWHHYRGDDTTALERLAEVEHMLWSPVQEYVVDFWLQRAQSAAALDRRDTVDESVRRLAEFGLHATGPAVRAAADEAEAALATVDGRWDDALSRYERAAQGWEVAPRWVLAADAWCEAAMAARRAAPSRAAALIERALRVAAAHGLGRSRRWAESLRDDGAAAPDEAHPSIATLTPRELEITRLVAAGRTNKEIGAELYLSEKTVRNVLSPVFAKLGVTRRSEIAALFARLG